MAGKSDYLEGGVLDHVLGVSTLTVAGIHLGLTTNPNAISDSDTGSTVTEPPDANYARVNILSGVWTATAGTPNPTGRQNNTDINFAAADAAYANPVLDFFLADAATAGQLLYYGSLQGGPIAIGNGETPRFQTGTLIVTED